MGRRGAVITRTRSGQHGVAARANLPISSDGAASLPAAGPLGPHEHPARVAVECSALGFQDWRGAEPE